MRRNALRAEQLGLTYIEVIIAAALMSIALIPAIEALHTGMLAGNVLKSTTNEHYEALARMEEVLAEPFVTLTNAAEAAGSQSTPSSYSDPAGPPDRRLVFLALYDAENEDSDNNYFTVLDPNLDTDNNPYTGYSGLLWVSVEIQGSVISLESLVAL